jgi:hypothetical protein
MGLALVVLAAAAINSSMASAHGPLAVQPGAPPSRVSILAACTAPPPEVGQVFQGVVLQVMDSRTFCVAQGPTPDAWIRVTIDPGPAGSTRETVMAASFGRMVSCIAIDAPVAGGVGAHCDTREGEPLDQLLNTGHVRQAALSWR